MPVHELANADIVALSIVKRGANRKRWFLRKAEGEGEGATVEFVSQRMIAKADWSAVYAVVAEPGALEGPGVGAADPETDDRWASEDEIRKAAHGFMRNGGLVNQLHKDLEPFGTLVENAVALDDFTVNGETIRKGSWYVAIEPTPDGRDAIEKGTFGGVSIQGTATRTLVEKDATLMMETRDGEAFVLEKAEPDDIAFAEEIAKHLIFKDAALVPNIPGKTNWVQRLGGLPKKIADLAGDLITEKGYTTSRAIATAVAAAKRFAAMGKPEWAAAVARWEAMKAASHVSKESSEDERNLGGVNGLITKFAEFLKGEGIEDEDLAKWDASLHPRGGKGTPAGGKFVKKGDKGRAVKKIQRKLGVKPDGTFGNLTRRKVRTFQRRHDLQVDGVVGEQTLVALNGDTAKAKKVGPGALTSKQQRHLFGRKRASVKKREGSSQSGATVGNMSEADNDRIEKLEEQLEDLTESLEPLTKMLADEEIAKAFASRFRQATLGSTPSGKKNSTAAAVAAGMATPRRLSVSTSHGTNRLKVRLHKAAEENGGELTEELIAKAVEEIAEDGELSFEVASAEEPTPADLKKTLDDFTTETAKQIRELSESVTKLGDGGSTQPEEGEDVKKADQPWAGIV